MSLRDRILSILLGSLVLFLSLGPSLHKMELPNSSNSAESIFKPCDCAEHRQPHNSDSQPLIFSDGDCELCKFYQQFNVTLDLHEGPLLDEAVTDTTVLSVSPARVDTRKASARGPPVASA